MIIRTTRSTRSSTYDAVEVPSAATGPLEGLTFAVKDIFDVAGYPTGDGSPLRRPKARSTRERADRAEMLDAGARFVGKTQTDEMTFSMNGQNKHFPEPVNVRAEGRITGGSSSGSAAAAAAGLCDFAIGSDTGGSVRAPASYCGLWGIRPTHGRVRSPRPAARALLRHGRLFRRRSGLFASRAGLPRRGRAAFRLTRLLRADDAFARLLSEREAEALRPAEAKVEALLGPASRSRSRRTASSHGTGPFATCRRSRHGRRTAPGSRIRDPVMTPGVRERFEYGKTVERRRAPEGGREPQASARGSRRSSAADGVLMLPTVPAIAPKRDLSGDALQAYRERALSILCIAGLSGLPQVPMPLATLDGSPLGLSLIGPRGADRALDRAGAPDRGGLVDTITRMRAFVAVVDPAASRPRRADGRSKALMSKYVAELEEELGARLLNRNTRQLSLTEAGEAAYEEAQEVLRRVARLRDEIEATTLTPRGRLRISMPRTFGDGDSAAGSWSS